MRHADKNPYQSPASSGGLTTRLLTPRTRELLTGSALALAIICILAVYGIAIAQLPARMWDRLGPEIYHTVTLVNAGILILGLLACCVGVIFGSWAYRGLAVWISLAYAPLIPTMFDWIARRISGL